MKVEDNPFDEIAKRRYFKSPEGTKEYLDAVTKCLLSLDTRLTTISERIKSTDSYLLSLIAKILDTLDVDRSSLEYGASWVQELLKDIDIPLEWKKKLGYWGDEQWRTR